MTTELAIRATINDIDGYRTKALEKFGEAFDTLEEARRLANLASISTHSMGGYLCEHAVDALAPRFGEHHHDERRQRFLTLIRQNLDRQVWQHLIDAYGLEKVMDKTARDQFRKQLKEDPLEATAENAYATMKQLLLDSDLIFKRGIATAFSALDRRFRSHDGFKFKNHVIINRCFDDNGYWNCHWHHDESIRDVERVFYVLDSKKHPDRGAGIIGAINATRAKFRFGAAAYTVDDDYFHCKIHKNGNLHLYFKKRDLLTKVNKLLAEFYGDALGASAEAAAQRYNHDPIRTPARNFGFFETPPEPAEKVIDHASIFRGAMVLEPNAGGGALARLAVAKGADVTCVEIQKHLVDKLHGEGIYGRVVHADFFDLKPDDIGFFDIIVMNPPFDGFRDIDHVVHALKFLKPGGRLVAIMGANFEFRTDKKPTDFRRLIKERRGDTYDLPIGSFAPSGTMVNTAIVILRG